ncbi:RNA polymerase sigma factor [Nostoc sp. NIES-2111]
MASETDEEIVARWRGALSERERHAALETLFERHYAKVALWCLRWAGDRDRAQDLAQEIFVKVQRGLESFEGNAKFTTWLFTICRNHCFNAAAASREKDHVEIDTMLEERLSGGGPGPEEQLAAGRKMELAREWIDKQLDATEKQVYLLHFLEGWSLPMVSRALDLQNASGAKAYLVSAQRKLKVAVERWKAKAERAK